MKLLCTTCDEAMKLERAEGPSAGSLAIVFRCPHCGHGAALLTNPWETQLVRSLGVTIGGQTVAPEPLATLRAALAGGELRWTDEARERLARVPEIARPMARDCIERHARAQGHDEVTPEVMEQARARLGL